MLSGGSTASWWSLGSCLTNSSAGAVHIVPCIIARRLRRNRAPEHRRTYTIAHYGFATMIDERRTVAIDHTIIQLSFSLTFHYLSSAAGTARLGVHGPPANLSLILLRCKPISMTHRCEWECMFKPLSHTFFVQ
jgi:hypothetical protein